MAKSHFTSKLGGIRSARKSHMCMACRHLQPETWGDAPCPNCQRVGTRHFFMSSAEQRRAAELVLLMHTGQISNLTLQPRFPLVVNGEEICTYVADFQYMEKGKLVIEDVKPKEFMDDGAKIKIKLFNALNRSTGTSISICRKK